jgi:hypothetical protein
MNIVLLSAPLINLLVYLIEFVFLFVVVIFIFAQYVIKTKFIATAGSSSNKFSCVFTIIIYIVFVLMTHNRDVPPQSPLLSLCNGSSISDTAGSSIRTNFLESQVGQSAIVPAFQVNPGFSFQK